MSNEGVLFNKYLAELIAWNEKFNLTAITDPEEIRRKHFDDSLLLQQVLPLTNQSIIDIGAGAGFPGIPLKLVSPEVKLVLLDSVGKKVEFMKHLIQILGLKETEAVWARAEDYAKDHRESFDLAISRAVAALPTLCEYCLPLVRVGGVFVAYKEVAIEAEVDEASKALTALGGRIREIIKFPARSLVLIDKVAPTPAHYPRRPGMAKKHPL